jgi:hypothetical protein
MKEMNTTIQSAQCLELRLRASQVVWSAKIFLLFKFKTVNRLETINSNSPRPIKLPSQSTAGC